MTALVAPPHERVASSARSDVPRDQPTVAIYEGTVRHRRVAPPHEFAPKLFLAYLDVDALPGSLDALPLWSARHPAPVRFRPGDFLDGTGRPLGVAVRDLVQARLGRRPTGPVHLLAQLRTFGWLFNPLAVYYCWTPDGRTLDAIVLEVTNTPWGERHWYVLDAQSNMTTTTTTKAMHVSPFLPMDAEYRITWTVPDDELKLRIAIERGHTRLFDAELELQRRTMSRRHAVAVLARYPLLTLRVSAGIYANAARLIARGVSFHRHPSRRRERTGR
jgi:DUF1365 family protein